MDLFLRADSTRLILFNLLEFSPSLGRGNCRAYLRGRHLLCDELQKFTSQLLEAVLHFV